MLPRENRLRNADFQKVLRMGVPFSFGSVSLKVRRNGLNKVRIGFSVSKKTTQSAAERNRIRRILRATFSKFIHQIKLNHDIVVILHIWKKEKKSFQFSDKETEKILKKSNLLKN
jgi:ribonuclease P protein component